MSRSQRVTQAQVAARAGVSRTIASFVLNGRKDQRVAPATAQRVLEAAAELGYRPNVIATILRTGESGTIALISDYITTTAGANGLVKGVIDGAHSKGTLLFTTETLGDSSLEQQLIANLIDRQVDGFIYASMFTREVVVPEVLLKEPTVLLNCLDTRQRLPSVLPDEEGAGRDAADLLIKAGRADDIAFIGVLPGGAVASTQWQGTKPLALSRRLAGLTDRLSRAGGSMTMDPIDAPAWDAPTGRRAMSAVLTAGRRPTAVVCANDALALGGYQAIAEAGLRIPDDISVVSFDGSELSSWMHPELTSLTLPHLAMGRSAVRLLLAGEDSPEATMNETLLMPMPVRKGASI